MLSQAHSQKLHLNFLFEFISQLESYQKIYKKYVTSKQVRQRNDGGQVCSSQEKSSIIVM